jgi:hypothetical protein
MKTGKDILKAILPEKASNDYHGSKLAAIALLLLAIVSFIRSCIHLFAPDGGAGSIAGIDVNVAGGDSVIFAFALWGSEQLLMAIVQFIVYFRYKNLIPLMYILLIGEILLRMAVGWSRPVTFSRTPPGAYANYIILPIAVLMLILSLLPRSPRRESLTH